MSEQYFATKTKEELISDLLERTDDYYKNLNDTGTMSVWAQSYDYYNVGVTDSTYIKTTGDNGQYKRINVNHYRNFIQHLMNLIISQRPAFEPRATNTDVKSQSQTILARGLLDYYSREKHLERNLRKAVEQCLVFGEGFVSTEWNETAGEVYAIDPDTQAERRSGDIEYSTVEAIDVIRDVHLKDWEKCQWIIIRSYVNKFDLAAKYFNLADLIIDARSELDPTHNYKEFNVKDFSENDLVEVFTFYHNPSPSMPDGRMVQYIDREIVLLDGPLPYRSFPIYRVTPTDITGTTQGYSPAFDLLSIQEAVNSLYSTVLTNQLTFGVQNVTIPTGTTINADAFSGMNLINYNPQFGKPEALNLTHTPPEIFNFIQGLEHTMETLSGVNSVARGNPEASLKSGAALALVQSMAIQSAQQLQQSYVQLLESVGTSTINILRDYASVPRIAEIAGKHNRGIMKEFTGDDLSSVNRVTVDIGNPMARTTAGKMELAEMYLKMGLLKTADQITMVMQTGNLDPMIENKTSELLAIRAENEEMAEGKSVMTMLTDEHLLHIQEHKSLLSDPAMRMQADLVQLVGSHIQEHFAFLTDPNNASLLSVLGQAPVQGATPAGAPGPMPPQGNGQPGAPMTANDQVLQMQPNMPAMPKNPMTGEQVPLPPGLNGAAGA